MDRLALLHEVALALSGDLDRRWLVEAIVNGARRLVGAQLAVMLSWDAPRGELVLETVSGDEATAALVSGAPASDLAAWVAPVFRDRAPLVVDDLGANPRAPGLGRILRIDAFAAVPLVGNDVAHGVLVVAGRRGVGQPPSSFTPEDLRVLEIYAAHAGLALASSETVAGAVRRLAQSEALGAAFREIAWARDREAILSRGLDCATSILGADRAAVYILNSREDICLVASRRLSRVYVEEVARRVRRSVGHLITVARTPIYVADMATDPRSRAMHELAAREGVHTTLLIPIVQRGQLYGALGLYHDLVCKYDPEDLARARALADEIAVALANAAMHQGTQRQLRNLRVMEQVARAAAECGTAAERAGRVAETLVERGGAVHAWVLGDGDAPLASAGAPVSDEVLATAHAALVAGTPVVRVAGATTLVAAPLREGGTTLGALVLAPPPPPPPEPRAPTFVQILADEIDPAQDLELAAAAAGHLAAGMACAREPAAAALAPLVAQLPGGVLVLDAAGRVLFHDREALRRLGLDGVDIAGWRAEDLARAGAAPLPPARGPLRAADGSVVGELLLFHEPKA